MPHMISYYDDDALPVGMDMMLAALPGGPHVFIRRSAIQTPAPFEEGWAAYRAFMQSPPKAPKVRPEASVLSIVPYLLPPRLAEAV